MRRKDRQMDTDFAVSVVDQCSHAVLATVNPDGTPYCVPLTIVRDGSDVFFHCALNGQKTDNLRRTPRICLACVCDERIPPRKFTTEYASAIVFGTAYEVTGEAEKVRALRLLCMRHTPDNMDAFDTEVQRSLAVTAVWRIHIDRITGKRKK